MRVLYDYFRSSACYRVRIALNLKGLAYDSMPVSLLDNAQRAPEYLSKNPQGLVPALLDGEQLLTQSLAICEYLEETYPQPALLPNDAIGRARVRALALSIACDIHPLNNLRVLRRLEAQFAADQAGKDAWYQHWIQSGFEAFEQQIQSTHGHYCFGDTVTLADLALVPQVYNARRFNCDLSAYPTMLAIEQRCLALDAFARATPEAVQAQS
ncbi:MAG: maleylacetoacetate isomerase [Burkholderiaceae bacterium]